MIDFIAEARLEGAAPNVQYQKAVIERLIGRRVIDGEAVSLRTGLSEKAFPIMSGIRVRILPTPKK